MQSHDKNNKCNHIWTLSHVQIFIPFRWTHGNVVNMKNKKRSLVLQPVNVLEQVTLIYFYIIMLIFFCVHLLFNVNVFGTCRVQKNYANISFSDFPKHFLRCVDIWVTPLSILFFYNATYFNLTLYLQISEKGIVKRMFSYILVTKYKVAFASMLNAFWTNILNDIQQI